MEVVGSMTELLREEKPESGLPRSKQLGRRTTKSESSASSRLTRERGHDCQRSYIHNMHNDTIILAGENETYQSVFLILNFVRDITTCNFQFRTQFYINTEYITELNNEE